MNVWGAFLGSLIRWILAALFGGLVVKGIITEELYEKLQGEGTTAILTGILGLAVPLLWSFWAKIKAKVAILVAKNSSPVESSAAVEQKAAEIPAKEKVAIALGSKEVTK